LKRKCVICGLKTEKWQRINGGFWHCYDGCKSTTGIDHRPILKYSTNTESYKSDK